MKPGRQTQVKATRKAKPNGTTRKAQLLGLGPSPGQPGWDLSCDTLASFDVPIISPPKEQGPTADTTDKTMMITDENYLPVKKTYIQKRFWTKRPQAPGQNLLSLAFWEVLVIQKTTKTNENYSTTLPIQLTKSSFATSKHIFCSKSKAPPKPHDHLDLLSPKKYSTNPKERHWRRAIRKKTKKRKAKAARPTPTAA